MSTTDLSTIEREIDEAFAENPLVDVPWTQSAWTLLSVVEDHHFKIAVMQPLPEREAAIYVDSLINALTYPMRVLKKRAPKFPTALDRSYIEAHYGQANDWLKSAEDYVHFCSIFPLYHSKEIEIEVNDDFLKATDWGANDLSYEAYDRFVAKRDPRNEHKFEGDAISIAIESHIRSSGGFYSIDFNRRLMMELHRQFGCMFEERHVLPENWQFTCFSLAQYRAVFVCLQLAAAAWFVARQIIAPGVPGIAYQSSVWTPRKGALIKLLAGYTKVPPSSVDAVLKYLTFGEVGIKNPDVAIQPLIDLGNGHYGIGPFLMTQIHAERNICVLLNQVPADKEIYAKLVNEKEAQIRSETIESLKYCGLDFRYGKLKRTDIDLAIIDHDSKICLCIELKWFIEPAEIREVLARSEELEKGICQARFLTNLYAANDACLLARLGIKENYDFQAMVGSVNFIGRPGIQDPNIPIVKLWHVVSKIKETGSLQAAVQWLRKREYLPVEGLDYKVQEVPIRSGKWRSKWYGIAHS